MYLSVLLTFQNQCSNTKYWGRSWALCCQLGAVGTLVPSVTYYVKRSVDGRLYWLCADVNLGVYHSCCCPMLPSVCNVIDAATRAIRLQLASVYCLVFVCIITVSPIEWKAGIQKKLILWRREKIRINLLQTKDEQTHRYSYYTVFNGPQSKLSSSTSRQSSW